MKSTLVLKHPSVTPLDTAAKSRLLAGALLPTGSTELGFQVASFADHEIHLERNDSGNGSSTGAFHDGSIMSQDDASTESDNTESYDEKQPHDLEAFEEIQCSNERNKSSRNSKEMERVQLSRTTSIPITLEKTEKRGRYLLTADDPELWNIIRRGQDGDHKSRSTAGKSTIFRDLVFTRQFTAFDRSDPTRDVSPFHGFFTLFWIATGLMIIRIAAQNWRAYGNVFGHNEIFKMMFGRDVFVMAMTDGFMCASTALTWVLQILIFKGYISWDSTGWIWQQVWQSLYLGCAVGWTFYRDWPWTHTIFIVLHSMVFLMKQHSYAAYNGYLSQVYKQKLILEKIARQLDGISPVVSPVYRAESPKAHSSARTDAATLSEDMPEINHPRFRRRLSSISRIIPSHSKGASLLQDSSDIVSVAEAITSGEALDIDQTDHIKEAVRAELDTLNTELKGKCKLTRNFYPSNLVLKNFAEWICLPTVVYELEYPRQDKIKWSYVAEKTAATFGVLAVMQVISQAYVYPLVMQTIRMRESGVSYRDRWQETPWIVLDLLFPLMLEQLLAWYLIWECVLNVLAELTCFADRGFYGDWWNAVSFSDYARDWNKPVHNFLLRHVYHSSISTFHFSKTKAMLATFLLSACLHELVMFCLFHKVRGYLFLMQLLQLPLAALSRTKLLKDRKVMGNIVFWFGIFVGPSILTGLYLVI